MIETLDLLGSLHILDSLELTENLQAAFAQRKNVPARLSDIIAIAVVYSMAVLIYHNRIFGSWALASGYHGLD